MSNDHNLVVGIDEAGRGPLAGPVTVAAFCAPESYRNKLIKILGGKIKDSKQLSPKRREEIYKEFKTLRLRSGQVNFCLSHISNKVIDKKGISHATRFGIKRCLTKLHHTLKLEGHPLFFGCVQIRLDGGLKASEEYKNQKTIIGGDAKDVFIACASIVAKVRRDRLMMRLGSRLPLWAFEIHKGYGTRLHYERLKKYGLSGWHRVSFCQSVFKNSKNINLTK